MLISKMLHINGFWQQIFLLVNLGDNMSVLIEQFILQVGCLSISLYNWISRFEAITIINDKIIYKSFTLP